MGVDAGHGGRGPEEGRVQASLCPLVAPQLSGIWYTAALASNNSALIEPGGHFRVFVNSLSTSDGNLNGQMLIPWVQGARGSGTAAERGGQGGPGEGTGTLIHRRSSRGLIPDPSLLCGLGHHPAPSGHGVSSTGTWACAGQVQVCAPWGVGVLRSLARSLSCCC